MAKFTRRIKRNHNKTKLTRRNYKRGGTSGEVRSVAPNKEGVPNNDEENREGVLDMITDRATTAAETVVENVGNMGLHALGLEKIQPAETNQQSTPGESVNVEPGILSSASNFADKATGAIINNVNEVLSSDAFQEGTKQASEETGAILKDTAASFNEALNNPIVKEEVKEALDTAGEYAGILADSMEEPVNKAVDVFAQAIPKATGAAVSGAIKVGTDMLGAIPGLGGIVEVGKMINDSSKAASGVIEAGSEAVESASDLFLETSENFKRGLADLEEKKRMAEQISNRTTQSINQFSKPPPLLDGNNLVAQHIPSIMRGGACKTRKKLLKNRGKSKRVRFAV